jgi:hypothetical protein
VKLQKGAKAVKALYSVFRVKYTCNMYSRKSSHLVGTFTSFITGVLLSDKLSVMLTPMLEGLILPEDGD